jgi:hypothetical protein
MTTGKVCLQLVAGKVMGLPGGRGSPIKRRDRDQGACPTRARIHSSGSTGTCCS